MSSRRIVMTGGVVLVALGLAVLALAQPGGFGGPPPGGGGGRPGGPGGDMQAMNYLEKAWTAVSFQLGCTPEQVETLKPTFAAELAARDQAVAEAMKDRDMEAMQKAQSACKSNLNAKLKEVLSDDQWQKLQKLSKPLAPPTEG